MIQVRLPDGSERQFAQPITVAEFAKSIGPGLAKAALAGKVNGELVDTSYVIESDATQQRTCSLTRSNSSFQQLKSPSAQ
jgi:threonyl-tRNA synthetase